jgi:hypothetical protein
MRGLKGSGRLFAACRCGTGTWNLRNSANWNCARLRKSQDRGEHWTPSPQRLEPVAREMLAPDARRIWWRMQDRTGSLIGLPAQPKAAVASVRIRKLDVMAERRTSSAD